MSVDEDSYEHWEALFSSQSIEALIAAATEGAPSFSLARLAALRNAFLDTAFHSKTSHSRERHLAACWACALESSVYALYSTDSSSLQAFFADRDSGRTLAEEYGYGTVLYLASAGEPSFAEKLFSGAQVANHDQDERRAFLLRVAFGRVEDDQPDA